MKQHTKKSIAPIVVSVLVILYIGFGASIWLFFPLPVLAKLIFSLIPVGLIGVTIFVLVERMKEIRSGEEDDLSNY